MNKFVTSGALKQTIDLTKENLQDHDARLQNIENATPTELQCENAITKIPDNVTNNIKLTSVQGKTLQNLVVKKATYGGYGQVVDDEFFETLDSLQFIFVKKGCLLVKPATQYTIIFDVVENTLNDWLRISPNDYVKISHYDNVIEAGKTGIFKQLVTTVSDFDVVTENDIIFAKNTANTTGKIKFRLMVLEGNWTNKEILPYFEGIQSVQNPLDVQVTGKNLLNPNRTRIGAIISSGVVGDIANVDSSYTKRIVCETIILQKGGSYTIQVSNGWYIHRTTVVSFDNKVIYDNPSYYSNINQKTVNVTSDMPFKILNTLKIDDVTEIGDERPEIIQIETGTIATAYEPYKQPIDYAIPFDGELRSLPNGVCDEIKDGKLIRRVGKYEVDATSLMQNGNYTTDTMLCVYLDNVMTDAIANGYYLSDNISGISNNFTQGASRLLPQQFRYGSNRYLFFTFAIGNDMQGTVDAKQWFGANPTIIYYQLAEPEIIELETIYNNPICKAYANGNIIQNNTPIHPTLQFTYNTGLQGKILALETEVAELSDIVDENDVINFWNN